jgi:hypothetical protein
MRADKNDDKHKLPRPEHENKKTEKVQLDNKASDEKKKLRHRQVNYIIKDLPIY